MPGLDDGAITVVASASAGGHGGDLGAAANGGSDGLLSKKQPF